MIEDKSQNLVWSWDNTEPFGDSVPNGDPSNTGRIFEMPLAFAGQYRDRETASLYNYFRNYDAVLGRYQESDLVGLLGGMNTYAYVGENPLSNTDPLGLFDLRLSHNLHLI